MKYLATIIVVALAIYLFYLMIADIDFSGMDFRDIKLIISVCIGIAVCFISLKVGEGMMASAFSGFVIGAITHVIILWCTEYGF